MIWKSAQLQDPLAELTGDPINSGWRLTDCKYQIVWFEGDRMPKDITQNISDIEPTPIRDGNENDDDGFEIEDSHLDESEYRSDTEIA